MLSVAKDKQQYNQKNDAAGDLTKKMRNWRLPFVFEIEIPNIAIHESDDERGAQQNRRCAYMVPPRRMNSVNRNGSIKGEYQREEPKQQAQSHTGSVLQEPANAQGNKKCGEENDRRDRVSLCFGNCAKHQPKYIRKEFA